MICSFQKPNSSSEITPTITYETTVSRSVGSRLSFIKEMAKATPCGPQRRTPCGFSPHLTTVHTITCTQGVQHLAHLIGYPQVAQTLSVPPNLRMAGGTGPAKGTSPWRS